MLSMFGSEATTSESKVRKFLESEGLTDENLREYLAGKKDSDSRPLNRRASVPCPDVVWSTVESASIVLGGNCSPELPSVVRPLADALVADKKLEKEQGEAIMSRLGKISTKDCQDACMILHCCSASFTTTHIALMRLVEPINFMSKDSTLVQFVVLVVQPEAARRMSLRRNSNSAVPATTQPRFAEIQRVLRALFGKRSFKADAFQASNREQMMSALAKHVQPGDDHTSSATAGLEHSGKCLGGGVIADLKRRAPWYCSDWKDGFNSKSIAAALFMYFGCLAPGIAFGATMQAVTNNQIGVVEYLMTQAITGVIFAIIGGQPLIILVRLCRRWPLEPQDTLHPRLRCQVFGPQQAHQLTHTGG